MAEATGLEVLPAPQQSLIGCDGTTFEVTLGGRFRELSVRWWVRPPDAWAAVARFAESLVRSCGSCAAWPLDMA